MAYLEELIPQQKLFRFDYLEALKALLPHGVMWHIPLPIEDDISRGSVASAEGFGIVTLLTAGVGIQPGAISSAEAVSSGLSVGEQFVMPIPIYGAEAFGQPLMVFLNLLAFCDFNIDLCASQGFDTAFMTNWYQTTESGEGIAQRATGGVDRFFPSAVSGKLLTGDFDVYANYWRSAVEVGNSSIHIEFFNSSDVYQFRQEYYNDGTGKMFGIYEVSPNGWTPSPAGPSSFPIRISRRSGVIWVYAWIGGVWVRADAWSTPGISHTNNADVYIKLDGGDAINGFAQIAVAGTLT